jgi:hypothetical protein
MNYFIIVNDAQQGPYTLEELRSRGITTDTLVWCEGMADWQPAWKVEELRPLFYGQSTPPPPPSSTLGQPAPGSAPGAAPVPPSAGGPAAADSAATAAPGSTSAAAGPANAPAGSGTATPPPTSMDDNLMDPTMGEPRKRSRTPLIVAAVVVVLLVIAAVSNPSADEHRRVIKEHLVTAVEKTFDSKDQGLLGKGLGMLSQAICMPVINETVDDLTSYHNYVFWSTTTVSLEDKNHTTSFGLFGHVFTMDEEELADSLSHALASHIQDAGNLFDFQSGSSDSQVDDQQDTATSQDDAQSDDGQSGSDDQIDQAARDMGDAIVDQVSKDVKKKISQQTDSATSSGISAIIDEIVGLFKGKQ